jgi:hypothetical protein
MELKLPKSIQEFVDDTPVSKIGSWFRLLITFYTKPIKFFKCYYQQSIADQFKQWSLYTAFNVFLLYVFAESEMRNSLRLIVSIFLMTIPMSMLLYITAIIVKVKHRIAIHSISFVFITIQLWQIPSMLFTLLFVRNEDFWFLFLSSSVSTYALFQVFFLFWSIEGLKISKVIASLAVSLIILNLFFCILSLIVTDHTDKNINSDPIIAELQYYLPDVKMTKGQPYSRIFNSENSSEMFDRISLKSNDTIIYLGKPAYLSYRKMVKSNIKIINSILKKLKFDRSKEIFTSLQDYYSSLDVFFDSEPPFEPYRKYNAFSYIDSVKVQTPVNEYVIDSTITNHYKEYLSKCEKLNEDDNFAYKSEFLPSLLLIPYYYLGEKIFKGEVYHVSTYF